MLPPWITETIPLVWHAHPTCCYASCASALCICLDSGQHGSQISMFMVMSQIAFLPFAYSICCFVVSRLCVCVHWPLRHICIPVLTSCLSACSVQPDQPRCSSCSQHSFNSWGCCCVCIEIRAVLVACCRNPCHPYLAHLQPVVACTPHSHVATHPAASDPAIAAANLACV